MSGLKQKILKPSDKRSVCYSLKGEGLHPLLSSLSDLLADHRLITTEVCLYIYNLHRDLLVTAWFHGPKAIAHYQKHGNQWYCLQLAAFLSVSQGFPVALAVLILRCCVFPSPLLTHTQRDMASFQREFLVRANRKMWHIWLLASRG